MRRLSKAIVVLATTALATLFAVGCLLAALFELQGFGAPQDQGPRPLYLALLAAGFVACIGAVSVVPRIYDRFVPPAQNNDPSSPNTEKGR